MEPSRNSSSSSQLLTDSHFLQIQFSSSIRQQQQQSNLLWKLPNLPPSIHAVTECVMIPTQPQYKLHHQWWILWIYLLKEDGNLLIKLNLLKFIPKCCIFCCCGMELGDGSLLPLHSLADSHFLLQKHSSLLCNISPLSPQKPDWLTFFSSSKTVFLYKMTKQACKYSSSVNAN